MIKIPQSILCSLQCALCDGYLSVSPIMVSQDGSQLCGKCFSVLPETNKTNYVKQIGFESIAEILIFPCRYNTEGCRKELLFNGEEDHEKECPYRHNLLEFGDGTQDQDVVSSDSYESGSLKPGTELIVTRETKDLKLKSRYVFKQNKLKKGNTFLKYRTEIVGNSRNKLCLQVEEHLRPVQIIIDGAICFRTIAEDMYCDITAKGVSDSAYSSIDHLPEATLDGVNFASKNHSCTNCECVIVNEVYFCGQGHDSCRNCRGKNCLACATSVGFVPKYHCRNAAMGCAKKLSATDVSKHETDCEYNSFRCPISNCNWHGILKKTKLHVQEKHCDKITRAQEIKKAFASFDFAWIMFAYGNIFKCKYFYYGESDYVELLVIYFGSHDYARRYKYEVEVFFCGKTKKKSATCIGWNGLSLDSGIKIEYKELCDLKPFGKRPEFNFDYILRIIDTSSTK